MVDADVESARRIVSLSPEVSRVLVRLGVAERVVAADRASLALVGLAHAQDLGEPCSLAAERVRALAADLVLELRPSCVPRDPGDARRLSFETPGLNGVLRAWLEIGERVGRAAQAGEATRGWTREISSIAVRRDGRERRVVAWVVAREPVRVVGPEGVLHEMLELAGAENAYHDGQGPLLEAPDALNRAGIDVVIDSSGGEAALEVAAPVTRLDPALSALPLLHPLERVRTLHEALYPQASAGNGG